MASDSNVFFSTSAAKREFEATCLHFAPIPVFNALLMGQLGQKFDCGSTSLNVADSVRLSGKHVAGSNCSVDVNPIADVCMPRWCTAY